MPFSTGQSRVKRAVAEAHRHAYLKSLRACWKFQKVGLTGKAALCSLSLQPNDKCLSVLSHTSDVALTDVSLFSLWLIQPHFRIRYALIFFLFFIKQNGY